MKALVFVLIGLFFLSLVSGASYPSPFTSDNTATVYGGIETPSTNIAASPISANLKNSLPSNGIINYEDEEGEEEEMFSEKDICELMKGCYVSVFEMEIDLESENNIQIDPDLYTGCLPYGYKTNNKYCGFKEVTSKYTKKKTRLKLDLFEQLNSSEECSNSFECKSNFCFNRECVDTIRTMDEEIVRINKSDLEELRDIIEEAEISFEENYDEEKSRGFFSSLSALFKRLFDWW